MQTHENLLKIVIKKEEDYEPWGIKKRWEKEDEKYPDCSVGCKYFIPLSGELGCDWGVCSNPLSHRSGLLTFEHQGCQKFETLGR
jgi:hypothetical protein